MIQVNALPSPARTEVGGAVFIRADNPMPDTAYETSAALMELIVAEVRSRGGRLPFDCFMELALYAPGLGYYVAGAEKLGAAGDFVTSPEVSPLFARALAVACTEVLDALDGGDVLELGAGTGALAAELLAALDAADRLPDRYLILEPSPELAARQRERLTAQLPGLVPRVDWVSTLPRGMRGVILANEVVDAMPVHRFRIDADGRLLELFVEAVASGLREVADTPVSVGLADAVAALQAEGHALAPGYCSEVNLRLRPWVAALAEALTQGLVLVIDYGYPRTEYYLRERDMGTLICHARHRAHADPYRDVGRQDITASVDFTALAEAGNSAGMTLAGYTTQANFLLGCGIDRLLGEAMSSAPDPGAGMSLAAGAKQLLLPTRMGERFQVMALARDLSVELSGFSLRDLSHRL
jgi:SAM-dependent MidA family methyltransferase